MYGMLKARPRPAGAAADGPNPGTMAAHAERLNVSESALSGYLRARNVPSWGIVERFCEVVQEDAGEPPRPLAELKELHGLALLRPCKRCDEEQHRTCRHCGHRSDACTEPRTSLPVAVGEGPGGRPADAGTVEELALPVPPAEGDRQAAAELTPLEPGLEEAIQYLRAGRDRDAHLVLAEAGDKLPLHRIPDVVRACQGQGFVVAADALLHSAARRPAVDVLHIVRLFNSAQCYHEADLVLKVATANQ
ncbi:helix-turn-helix domain-containing protein [Kitasatospora sp. NPDC051170]|uniref:helix-turn-helix domain-containing protein n=1 Tax=Kitasatospora sp. NPDC051170 TaxID=3364056 RepID=UPI0037B76D1A